MAAMLDFRKHDYSPMYRLTLVIFHYYTKYDAKSMIDAEIMAQKRNLRWRLPPS